ncbi:MAG: structural protein P5 [Micavibrio aeruginosavorus]|uniref:Structural protein P5 n=1 Tax=Micavibrio aeruginosavorus TaxID=349221 RepID=A0A2W5PR94_9BACT|nr:MAG: structural protein P5 [Micavibrio aeruginosavorus]
MTTTQTGRTPRGIRNHNPGNIRRNSDPWQGLAERQSDVEFFTFKSPIYGIRALARTLITYQDKHGLRTIRQIIGRWAPPVENNTNAYVRAVAEATDLDADQMLDLHNFDYLFPLTKAIIKHENGQQPYTDAQITKALVLAGVEPEAPSLQKTRTVKGGQAATAATAGVGVIEVVQQTIDPARDALIGLAPYLEVAKWLLLAVTLIGIGVMLWARIDDHRKGLR